MPPGLDDLTFASIAIFDSPAGPLAKLRRWRVLLPPMMPKKLFEINPALDRPALAQQFARETRIQIRDFLTHETAEEIRTILARGTHWGMAMQADGSAFDGPQQIPPHDMQSASGRSNLQQIGQATHQSASEGKYAFRFAQYPMIQAIKERWAPDGPHELLIEYINTPEFLDLVRDVTGETGLIKADGQATLFAPQHFLGLHIDSHVMEGWRIAYVMNFTVDDWRPDWGGYLNFHDDEGDIIQGFKPRFNALNLFRVPQPHSVSFVPPFSPVGRYAITGWLRDR